MAARKKEREKECANELVAALDQLPLDSPSAWCQMPEASVAKREVEPADLERLTSLVCQKFPKTTIQLPEPTAFVLVAAMPWGPNDKQEGVEVELATVEKFDAGFAE